MSNKILCGGCGKVYPLWIAADAAPATCDECGTQIAQRHVQPQVQESPISTADVAPQSANDVNFTLVFFNTAIIGLAVLLIIAVIWLGTRMFVSEQPIVATNPNPPAEAEPSSNGEPTGSTKSDNEEKTDEQKSVEDAAAEEEAALKAAEEAAAMKAAEEAAATKAAEEAAAMKAAADAAAMKATEEEAARKARIEVMLAKSVERVKRREYFVKRKEIMVLLAAIASSGYGDNLVGKNATFKSLAGGGAEEVHFIEEWNDSLGVVNIDHLHARRNSERLTDALIATGQVVMRSGQGNVRFNAILGGLIRSTNEVDGWNFTRWINYMTAEIKSNPKWSLDLRITYVQGGRLFVSRGLLFRLGAIEIIQSTERQWVTTRPRLQ